MGPSSQSGPQPMQSGPQPERLPPKPQTAPQIIGGGGSGGGAPRPRRASSARGAIAIGALLIAALAIGAFGSGLVKIPGANTASIPVVSASQTESAPINEEDKVHWIGIQIQNVAPDLAKSVGSSRTEGVVVRTVRSNSPAEEAGIRPDDVLIAADGVPIRQVGDLTAKIRLTAVGDQIALTLERSGTIQGATVRVTLRNRCQTPGSTLCSN
jgi:hypothetical protein